MQPNIHGWINRKVIEMDKSNVIAEIKNLSHHFLNGAGGDFLVLDNINLTLYEDEIVCLLGRSGSGKSTLLRCISGLTQPTEGLVTIQNTPLAGPRAGISMVFQNFALFPWLNVLENVEFGLEAQKISAEEKYRLAIQAIDMIGLDGNESAYPKELSGGMQQRVGLARALVMKPSLLLMDEPFSALDVLTAEILRADILDLWIEGQMNLKSMLMVTHNIEEAVLMADRILLLSSNPGRIISEIKVFMPQPRNRLDPEFRSLVDSIFAKMTEKEMYAAATSGVFPGMGIGMVLERISTNILQGFLEMVATHYNGAADLPKLAEIFGTGGDEILKIAEMLQMLRFCELDAGVVKLTIKGKEFAASSIDERKKLFRAHLVSYIPLAAHMHSVLEGRRDHSAPMIRFRDEIEDYMPEELAKETMETVISLARYAELFAYNEQTQKVYLE
jgi:NitT/TauT family transport system ATP-binding protein